MLADHIGVPQLRDLASRSEQIATQVSVRDMSRLLDLVHSAEDGDAQMLKHKLNVKLVFLGGMQGFPEISCKVSGQLDITCQRCLGALDWPIDIDTHLVVVESEADLEKVVEPYDAVVADEHGVDFIGVIEDELLASLPLAPMHDDLDKCDVDKSIYGDVPEDKVESEVSRPFADLASLLGKDQKP